MTDSVRQIASTPASAYSAAKAVPGNDAAAMARILTRLELELRILVQRQFYIPAARRADGLQTRLAGSSAS